MKNYSVKLSDVSQPLKDCTGIPVTLLDETMQHRKNKILQQMTERELDQLILYGDPEHGSNFEYLVGFYSRFEEALLIINKTGDMTMVLGNENLNKVSHARIEANAIHVSLFSLPNQPNRTDKTFKECMIEAGVKENTRVGLVGWKLFTSNNEQCKKMFDLPSFIVDTIKDIVNKDDLVTNEADLLIGPEGVRTTNNANEIAHYEFYASMASDCMLDAMNKVDIGVSEFELGDALVRGGQHTSIVTIAASGQRYIKGNMYPSNNTIKQNDTVSLSVGYRGGASCRVGYAASSEDDLEDTTKDFVKKLAVPYFKAYVNWLEEIQIGMQGKEMFDKTEEILPRSVYNWSLCPGHLTADEEWLTSPIYEGSQDIIKSGMIFQVDIIPSLPGYGGINAESTVVLADEHLKSEIQSQYPELWERMQKRILYLKNVLGIELSKDVLPMCSTLAYVRPFMLDKKKALLIEN